MSNILKEKLFGPLISVDIPVQVSIRNIEKISNIIKEDITFEPTHLYNTRATEIIKTDYSSIVSYHHLFDSLVKSDIDLVHNDIIQRLLTTYNKDTDLYSGVSDKNFGDFQRKLIFINVPLWTPGIYTTFKDLRANSDSYINKIWKEYNKELYLATSKNCKETGICIACGRNIISGDSIECDHLIPVIQALISIKSNHANNELNYLHSCCNRKKSNMSLLEFMAAVTQNEFLENCPLSKEHTIKEGWPVLINKIVSKINELELYTQDEQINNILKLEKFLKLQKINKETHFINFKGTTKTEYDQLLQLQSNIMFNTDTVGSSSQFGRINNKKLKHSVKKSQKKTNKKLKHLAKKYSLKLNKHLIKNIKSIKKLQKEAKKKGVRITKKIKGKRKYKTKSQLIKELKYI